MSQNTRPITLLLTKPRLRGQPDTLTFAATTHWLWLPAFELSVNELVRTEIHQWLACTVGSKRMVVFVSPSAIELTHHFFPQPWPKALLCGLMGEGSASKALGLGMPQECLLYPKAGSAFSQDSTGLFKVLEHQGMLSMGAQQIKHLLIVKGPQGRRQFAQECSEAGVLVQQVQGYERNPAGWASSVVANLVAVLTECSAAQRAVVWSITSSAAVGNIRHVLHTLLPPHLVLTALRAPVFTTHAAIALSARNAGFESVHQIAVGELALDKAIQQI